MKIYDISQEVLSSEVYPGDPIPKIHRISSMEKGDLYNLCEFSMCAHNGTHVDAPCHFIPDGNAVADIDLYKTVGYAYVVERTKKIGSVEAREIIAHISNQNKEAAKRILIKGMATVTADGAEEFRDAGVVLIGSETQSVGPVDSPMQVHKILLKNDIVLLEGIRLSEVPDGVYFLSAAPINLGISDGAPCRAILIKI